MRVFPKQLVTTARKYPQRVFLADGLGAALSAFMHGAVLTTLEPVFGMPKPVLIPLALIACGFAAFSLVNGYRNPANWQPLLRAIAIANLCFCAISLALICYYFPKLTAPGCAYFILEIIIVVLLAALEIKIAAKHQEIK